LRSAAARANYAISIKRHTIKTMAAKQYVYLVRLGDAAVRAYTSRVSLLAFLRTLEPHLLQRYLIQRLEIGDIEQGLNIMVAADVLAIWKKSGNA
jgi:hypothetical protein